MYVDTAKVLLLQTSQNYMTNASVENLNFHHCGCLVVFFATIWYWLSSKNFFRGKSIVMRIFYCFQTKFFGEAKVGGGGANCFRGRHPCPPKPVIR